MSQTARNIIFWVLAAALFLGAVAVYKKFTERGDAESQKRDTIVSMAHDALIIGIIALMGFVPSIGYIAVVPGVISLTLVHIPVLLGAYLFGWKRGLFYGIAFGITSWIQASMNPTGLNFFFIYPWVSVLPRAIFGFSAGLLFELLRKKTRIWRRPIIIGVLSFLLSAWHTALVISSLFLFFGADLMALASSFGGSTAFGVTLTFFGILILGALGEAIVAAIAIPPLAKGVELANRKVGR